MNNTADWKEFCLNDLFEICSGNYRSNDEYEVGDTPYITASARNNGIANRINLSPEFEGNAITTGKVGCIAFYQKEDFCASSDVNILRAKKFKLNYRIGMFISSVINFSENYKWAYGRQCRIGNTKKIKIKLPILYDNSNKPIKDFEIKYNKEGFVPDFQYMENYISILENENKKNPISKSLKTKNKKFDEQIDFSNWREFTIDEIFDVKYGVNLELNNCDETTFEDEDAINFVSRSRENNGVTAFVKKIEGIEPQEAGIITVAGGGSSVLSTFVQKKPFYSGRDLYLLIPRYAMSIYTKQFICTIIMANKYKYSYGRQANKTLSKLIIELPSKDKKPDFEYMESYVKKLPLSDKIK